MRLGGGVATIREYLRAGLVDEMHLAISAAVLGSGENLFAGLDLPALGYEPGTCVPGERAMHAVLRRKSTAAGERA